MFVSDQPSALRVCVVFPLQRGAIVSEPAIQVRRKGKGTQVWTIEKLENKLVDMRDQYREWKEGGQDTVRDHLEFHGNVKAFP